MTMYLFELKYVYVNCYCILNLLIFVCGHAHFNLHVGSQKTTCGRESDLSFYHVEFRGSHSQLIASAFTCGGIRMAQVNIFQSVHF